MQDGANGTVVVLLSIAHIEQSAIFSDDNGLLRRIAYVETRDGTRSNSTNIWAVSEVLLESTKNTTNRPLLAIKHGQLSLEFGFSWVDVVWEELFKPLYSAVAARLLLSLAPEMIPDSNNIPGQAQFWKQYYNSNGSLTEFIRAAEELEGK